MIKNIIEPITIIEIEILFKSKLFIFNLNVIYIERGIGPRSVAYLTRGEWDAPLAIGSLR